MEDQVYRIWTILSTFEESSAACISEMLRHVSGGMYLDGVGMAEKFVLHVETLFAAIDELGASFRAHNAKGASPLRLVANIVHVFHGFSEISHVREARMLCKKVVNFFSLLSQTHEAGARKMGITQELLSLVTGLAHYLKILIRISLTGALKLERDHGDSKAIAHFLARLDRLARDPTAHTASVPLKSPSTPSSSAILGRPSSSSNSRRPSPERAGDIGEPAPAESGQTRTYGYKSLARAVGTLVGQGEATTDLCEGCHLTVEEECARFATSRRWHLPCLRCSACQRPATRDRAPQPPTTLSPDSSSLAVPPPLPKPLYYREFRIDENGRVLCSACCGNRPGARAGFEYVTRLEQYAFLLCVALNKLYALLKQRGVVPPSPSKFREVVDRDRKRPAVELIWCCLLRQSQQRGQAVVFLV
jgi:hypothetical protein